MSENKSFLKGAAILGIAGVIVKILGAIYRVPLSNIIQSEGMGYYQTAYPFYSLLLTISTAGFPIAIAKLVSEKRSVEDYKGAFKIFKVSFVGLFFTGLITSLYLFFRAESIVIDLGNKNAYYALIALIPALFFVPIMSAFRGFFQGCQTMTPTAISQVVEQFFRVVAGLGLTYYLLDSGIPKAAGGASLGGSVGAIAGTIVMLIVYWRKRSSIKIEIAQTKIGDTDSVSKIIKDLLVIAVPITIGSSIGPIMDYIDLKLVLTRLQTIGYSEAMANDLYGNLKGMAQTLINLPQVFSVAIAMSLVPAISDAFMRQDQKEIDNIVSSGLRITLLIGLPAALGLLVLSKPIIGLLYYKNPIETINNTGNILGILSIGVIFLTLVQSLSGILQGIGKPMLPAINLFIGAIVKVFLTYFLTVVPSINIYGAAISTVVAYAIAAILDLINVILYSKVKLSFKDIFMKPFISAFGMAIVARLSYNILEGIIGSKLSTLAGIILGALTYLILLIVTGSITEEDFKIIPKGEKIYSLIKNLKIIN